MAVDLDRLAAQGRRVLKAEPEALVEVLGDGPSAVVRKIYTNRGRRFWQSLWRQSRARREHDNLLAAAATGARVTDAIAWSETRRLGGVVTSTLVTRYLPGSASLKQVLAQLDRTAAARTRRALVRALGTLLATLHRGGFLWGTPMPRNVLVLGDPAHAELAVCDTPMAIACGRPLHGGALATIDLFAGAFSPSRRRDFSAPERLRWLLGYCGDDRALARVLWRRLARRTQVGHDLRRALARLWFTHILLPLAPRSRNLPSAP